MKFADILKGIGQWATVEGRDQAQNLRNIMLASKVKRIRPEDFENIDEYNKALAQSNMAHGSLQSELSNPSANAVLNQILSVSPEAQARQGGEQMYGYDKANPQGKLISPTMIKDTMTMASKTPSPQGLGLLGSMIFGGASAGLAGGGMSTQGNEIKDTLTAIPFGVAGGAVSYGAQKLGSSLVGKVKAAKPASDQATRNLGLSKKAIEDLGGWNKAKEFAGELFSDAKSYGLDTKDRYARANALSEMKNIFSQNVDDVLSSSTAKIDANKVVSMLDSNDTLKILRAADNDTYNGIVSLIMDNADETGQLPVAAGKKVIEQLQKVAGGFENTIGDQSAITKQILTEVRSVLRDSLQQAVPEAGDLLSKWSRYIKASPSIEAANVAKSSGLTVPGTFGKVGGSAVTKGLDRLSSALAGTGSPETVSNPSFLKGPLEAIGRFGQSIPGAIGSLVGNNVESQGQMPEQLGEDDPGLMAIRSAFESQPQGMGGQNDQLKQALAMGVLGGEISSSDAQFILEMLGGAQEEEAPMTALQSKAQSALTSIDTLEGILNGEDKNVLINQLLPWQGGNTQAQIYNSAATDIMDTLARLRTGAVINEKEEKMYRGYIPKITDTPERRQYKLQLLRQVFGSLGGQVGESEGQSNDILQSLGLQ